jgi:hypothetical protein
MLEKPCGHIFMLAVLREDLFMSLAPETTRLFWYGGIEKVSLQRLEDFCHERGKKQATAMPPGCNIIMKGRQQH